MKIIEIIVLLFTLTILSSCNESTNVKSQLLEKTPMLKALIIDGQNNHGIFPKTTMMMKDFLEETGLFEVEIKRTQFVYQGPHHGKVEGVDSIQQLLEMYPLRNNKDFTIVNKPKADPNYLIDFDSYDLVVCNFGWQTADWPVETKLGLHNFVQDGGGFLLVHAANNAFGNWDEFNEMIGLGGWGGRNMESGPYVYYDEKDQLQYDHSDGKCGAHGPESEFIVKTRASEHPIMKDLPTEWLHSKDELYGRLRGPAKNMTILATAMSELKEDSLAKNAEGEMIERHEPMLMAIEYGKGRVFHSALGHMDYSMECVGFITTLQRGAEWAATGKVTQAIPEDFPGADKISIRAWTK